MTHCPMPSAYSKCVAKEACVPGAYFSGAHTEGKAVPVFTDRFIVPIDLPRMYGELYRSRTLFDFSDVDQTRYPYSNEGSVFYTSIFFRRNYDFRSRASEIVHAFRETTMPRFDSTQSCIGIHIRHHDRVKEGYDMSKYCNEFVRRTDGTCYNKTSKRPIETDCRLAVSLLSVTC